MTAAQRGLAAVPAELVHAFAGAGFAFAVPAARAAAIIIVRFVVVAGATEAT